MAETYIDGMTDHLAESAKAVQATAETAGKALDLVQGAPGWIGEVIGRPVAEAVGYYVTDRLQAKRMRAAIYDQARLRELLHKVDERFSEHPAHIRPLPPKVAIPLLENATCEFDDELHDLWASLLATAIDAEAEPVERQYVSILAELSAGDAKTLEAIWRDSLDEINRRPVRESVTLTHNPSIDTGEYPENHVMNLHRLGLIKAATMDITLYHPEGIDYRPSMTSAELIGDSRFVVITDLGRGFCNATGLSDPPI